MKTPILVFFVDHSFVALCIWIHERKITFFLWSRFSLGRMRMWESVFVWLSLTVCDRPHLPEGGGYLLDDGFCDFAFGFAQNDRGGKYTAEIDNFRNRETNLIERPNIPTKKGFDAMCIGFWLMLGTLFFYWFMCLAFNKSGSNPAVCRCIV